PRRDVADLVPVRVVGVHGGDGPTVADERGDDLGQLVFLVVGVDRDLKVGVLALVDVAVAVVVHRLGVPLRVGDRCPIMGLVVAVDRGERDGRRAGGRGRQAGLGGGDGDQVADVVVAVVSGAGLGDGAGAVHLVLRP